MALEINHVREPFVTAAAKKMIECDLVESGRRSVGGNMAADVGMEPVGFHDHGQGVPAHIAFDAPLDFAVAGISRLFFDGNRVDVRRGDGEGNLEAGFTQSLDSIPPRATLLARIPRS